MADFQREVIAYRSRYEDRLQRDPVLRGIQQRIGMLGIRKMQETLDGRPTETMDAQLARLEKEKETRIRHLGLKAHRCSRCGDRGYIAHEACRCLRRYIYRDHYGALDTASLRTGFADYPFEILDDVEKQPVYDATHQALVRFGVREFRDLINSYPNGGRGLLISGPAGVGKTYLALRGAAEAYQRGLDVLYLRATEMHDLYHRYRLGKEVEPYYLETSGLLIVDDLGTEPVTKNVTIEALYRVIEERHLRLLPTVFISNLFEFRDTYGERIASRLFDTTRFQFLPITGDDLRLLEK